MNIEIKTQQGEKVREIELNPAIFGQELNEQLMALAVRVRLHNRRIGTHKTKSRGEVSGGGRKPWRQKGTGRARHGSIRSPIWVGGGHVKAKQPRNYGLKISRPMKRQALFSSLSSQARNGNLIILDQLNLDKISTRQAQVILKTLSGNQKVLLVLPEPEEKIIKSFRNLPQVQVLQARYLNTYDVLNAEKIIMPEKSLAQIEQTFLRAN